MRELRHAVFALIAVCSTGCEVGSEAREPPTEVDIDAIADAKCAQSETCYAPDPADLAQECETWHDHLTQVLSESNADCKDIWLVYEYHECRASLGCQDLLQMSPEDPNGPCHEELMAVYDGECAY